jgi:NADH-quinone oxidoreductase subunit G
LGFVAEKFKSVAAQGGKFGVAAGTRQSNEEYFYLQKFSRTVLNTANIDHPRTGDVLSLLAALGGDHSRLATADDLYRAKASLVIGSDLSQQHPFLAFQIRAAFRHFQSKIFTITEGPVREAKYSAQSILAAPSEQLAALSQLEAAAKSAGELVIIYGDTIKGQAVRNLVDWANGLGIPTKFVPLVDDANSRGALDMGITPDFLPGYAPAATKGLHLAEMIAATDLDVFWSVGGNPLAQTPLASRQAFVVAHSMFLDETAQRADVVFPSASAYEKNGTVTNVTGQVQRWKAAAQTMGVKSDLEIMGLLGKEMGVAAQLGVWTHDAVFKVIHSSVAGYNVPLPVILTGGAGLTRPALSAGSVDVRVEDILSVRDTLFTSGSLGKYSKLLTSVPEYPGTLYGRQ